MRTDKEKIIKKQRRARRVRARIFGVAEKPRLSVFRSNSHLYCQLIDDAAKKTLCASSDKALGQKIKGGHITVAQAKELGVILAKKAQEKGIKKVIFDRGNYKYHGRVKSLAEGAREGGLEF